MRDGSDLGAARDVRVGRECGVVTGGLVMLEGWNSGVEVCHSYRLITEKRRLETCNAVSLIKMWTSNPVQCMKTAELVSS